MVTRARIALSAALVAVAFLTALPAADAATGPPKTAVYGFGGHCPPTGWSDPHVRPVRGYFSLACENGVRGIHWQYWRRLSAFGHATTLIFNGTGFTRHRGTISLSGVRRHHGRRYFSHLAMKWSTSNGRHHQEVLSWKRDGRFWLWLGNYSGT